MLGKDFLDHLKNFQVANYVGVEDFVDKFNFLITVLVLLLCTAIVTVKTYFLSAVECALSGHTEALNIKDYTMAYCWSEGTYVFHDNVWEEAEIKGTETGFSEFINRHKGQKIVYYQWIPFLLGLQCIMFYFPRLVWQILSYNKTGTDLAHIVAQANEAVHADSEKRVKLVKHIVATLQQLLFLHREYRVGKVAQMRRRLYNCCKFFIPSKRLGTWLVFLYLVVKLMYLANCLGQIYFMQTYLGLTARNFTGTGLSSLFGYQLASQLLHGKSWHDSLVFPRVGFCPLQIKGAGLKINYFVQCALPINMINEKIYVFLWFWFVFCAIITGLSIPVWITRMLFSQFRFKFIRRFLKLSDKIATPENRDIRKFEKEFLRHDGTFIIRMIALNCGDLICCEIVCGLYEVFEKHHYDVDFRGEPPPSSSKAKSYNMTLPLEDGGTAVRRKPSHATAVPSAPQPPSELRTLLMHRGEKGDLEKVETV